MGYRFRVEETKLPQPTVQYELIDSDEPLILHDIGFLVKISGNHKPHQVDDLITKLVEKEWPEIRGQQYLDLRYHILNNLHEICKNELTLNVTNSIDSVESKLSTVQTNPIGLETSVTGGCSTTESKS